MFKVQLIKISDKVIKDKTSNQEIKFVVLKLLEIDKETGVPTGEMQDKYLKDDSELLLRLNLSLLIIMRFTLIFLEKLLTSKN